MDEQQFLSDIISEAMPDMDETGKTLLIQDMEPILEDWIITNITHALTPKQVDELQTLLSKKASEKQIHDFFEKNIQDYDVFLAEVYENFKINYLSEFKQ